MIRFTPATVTLGSASDHDVPGLTISIEACPGSIRRWSVDVYILFISNVQIAPWLQREVRSAQLSSIIQSSVDVFECRNPLQTVIEYGLRFGFAP